MFYGKFVATHFRFFSQVRTFGKEDQKVFILHILHIFNVVVEPLLIFFPISFDEDVQGHLHHPTLKNQTECLLFCYFKVFQFYVKTETKKHEKLFDCFVFHSIYHRILIQALKFCFTFLKLIIYLFFDQSHLTVFSLESLELLCVSIFF